MKDFELMLAPMENRTNPDFRELCYNNGADSTFTEMARITGLANKNKSTLNKIIIPTPIPTYIQLTGSKENELDRFLKDFIAPEGFLGFNLNLGCPSSDVIRIGQGCALIKRISKVRKLIRIIRVHGYPASIKLRLGMNQYEKDKKVYLNLINEVDADFFVVHARQGKETKYDPVDTDAYIECVKTKKVIIANGSIRTKDQIKHLKSIGVRGAMIGLFALENPKIFSELKKGL